jgi:fatty acyl-CoA reductase
MKYMNSNKKYYFRFDDTNTEKLRRMAKGYTKNEELNFDPTSIDWTNYMMNTHIPGLVKYEMRESLRPKL